MIAYETTFICRPEISESNHKTFMEKLKGIITTHQGEVVAIEDWGRRRLSYPIKKETRGYYTYILFTGNNTAVAEIERNLRINEQVIRFLTVKIQDDFDAKTFKRKPTPNLAASVTPNVTPVVPNAAPSSSAHAE